MVARMEWLLNQISLSSGSKVVVRIGPYLQETQRKYWQRACRLYLQPGNQREGRGAHENSRNPGVVDFEKEIPVIGSGAGALCARRRIRIGWSALFGNLSLQVSIQYRCEVSVDLQNLIEVDLRHSGLQRRANGHGDERDQFSACSLNSLDQSTLLSMNGAMLTSVLSSSMIPTSLASCAGSTDLHAIGYSSISPGRALIMTVRGTIGCGLMSERWRLRSLLICMRGPVLLARSAQRDVRAVCSHACCRGKSCAMNWGIGATNMRCLVLVRMVVR
jgi:hypothetical protein